MLACVRVSCVRVYMPPCLPPFPKMGELELPPGAARPPTHRVFSLHHVWCVDVVDVLYNVHVIYVTVLHDEHSVRVRVLCCVHVVTWRARPASQAGGTRCGSV